MGSSLPTGDTSHPSSLTCSSKTGFIWWQVSEPTWRINSCPCGTRSCYVRGASSRLLTICLRIRHSWYTQGTGRSTISSWVWLRHWRHTVSSITNPEHLTAFTSRITSNLCCFERLLIPNWGNNGVGGIATALDKELLIHVPLKVTGKVYQLSILHIQQ